MGDFVLVGIVFLLLVVFREQLFAALAGGGRNSGFIVAPLNDGADTVRHEIIERYRPGEDDPHLRILQAAHIEDDEYFSHMIQDDISAIVRDIRAVHKSDSESAPPTTIAKELKQDLEDVTNFKGSPLEKQATLYCKRLGINYNKLSDVEFRQLVHILEKSKFFKSYVSQRKKPK